MPREIVDAAIGSDGTLWAVSADVPGDGEDHNSSNRLHELRSGVWQLKAEWTGWLPTGLAVTPAFAIVPTVKQHIIFIHGNQPEVREHAEPERCLNCILATPGQLLVGGSTGYYLSLDPVTGSATPHNLSSFGIEKPRRDIYTILERDGRLLFVGSHRLLLSVAESRATLLMAPGPTAATPNFHSAARLCDTLYLASFRELWRYDGAAVQPVELPPTVAEQLGLLAIHGGELVVGGNEVFALSPHGPERRSLYRHLSGSYVRAFVQSSESLLAVFSDGLVIELPEGTVRAGSLRAGGA